MENAASNADEQDPAELFAAASERLIAALDDAIAPWIMRCIEGRLPQPPEAWSDDLTQAARTAAANANDLIATRLTALLARDVDAQSANPLMVIRDAVKFPTAVLDRFGGQPVRRDEFEQRAFPDDRYGLSPAGFNDIDESLQDVGLFWGAAKAHLVLTRRSH